MIHVLSRTALHLHCSFLLLLFERHHMNTSSEASVANLSAFSSLTFSAYTPRWLPQGHIISGGSRSLLGHVVGGPQESGALSQLQKLASMGYDATAAKSGAAWWLGVSTSGAASSQGAPPATDYNRLLGLEQLP
jgi:hypothetical protein